MYVHPPPPPPPPPVYVCNPGKASTSSMLKHSVPASDLHVHVYAHVFRGGNKHKKSCTKLEYRSKRKRGEGERGRVVVSKTITFILWVWLECSVAQNLRTYSSQTFDRHQLHSRNNLFIFVVDGQLQKLILRKHDNVVQGHKTSTQN